MKTKNAKTTIKTREDLESVAGEYAAQVIEMDRLTIEMEKKIQEIRSAYVDAISACKEIGDGLFEDMESWARLHPAEFGAGKKSLELLHATIGFRIAPPAVRQRRGVKVADTIEALKRAGLSVYVRTKEELDKARILADSAAKEIGAENLPAYGIEIVQDEAFYADAKRENKGE